jgi:hypothetical protein
MLKKFKPKVALIPRVLRLFVSDALCICLVFVRALFVDTRSGNSSHSSEGRQQQRQRFLHCIVDASRPSGYYRAGWPVHYSRVRQHSSCQREGSASVSCQQRQRSAHMFFRLQKATKRSCCARMAGVMSDPCLNSHRMLRFCDLFCLECVDLSQVSNSSTCWHGWYECYGHGSILYDAAAAAAAAPVWHACFRRGL